MSQEFKFYGFGANWAGQLGLGDTINRLIPTEILGLNGKHAIQISLGSSHTLVLTNDLKIYVFGSNVIGQIGLGNRVRLQLIPVELSFFSGRNIHQISAGGEFTIVLLKDFKVFSFGNNRFGQLGLGDNQNRDEPVESSLFIGKNITEISANIWLGFAKRN